MGTPQLTYGQPADALIGQPVNTTIRGFVTSDRACESASIDFGLMVGPGSSDTQCTVGGTTPLGIAMRDGSKQADADGDGQYVQYDTVNIIDQDFVYINTASASGAYGATVCGNSTTGAITIEEPSSGKVAIGWLAQTVSAAGLARIFVDSRMCKVDAVKVAGVEIDNSALADDYVLVYDSSAETLGFEPCNAAQIVGIDVDASSIADNYILKYNDSTGNLEYEADAIE